MVATNPFSQRPICLRFCRLDTTLLANMSAAMVAPSMTAEELSGQYVSIRSEGWRRGECRYEA